MPKHPSLAGLVLMPLALLAACASVPANVRNDADLARYESYAGPPVGEISYMGSYQGWKPLSRQYIVLWTTPWEAYLIRVEQPCADLPFSFSMKLDATESHLLQTRVDSIKTQGWSCPIQQIRPLDYRRMQADLKRQAPPPQGAAPPKAAD